ncbi:peptidoglycan -binding protein [Limobrevibacterium gyesilva]|uniref:Peptidoglycan -binding protein n=1 Tax=Limobrevibacterium gyesilva TaxID=2991712 RepID=A0AA42CHN2_9PROT|nr:peptidoglycan -binding protein [Limobrevibacterium gyesilva]MCW3477436.1 peptidoglycan -binding protein [Limobrevibacterium gyesilva]
MALRRRGTNGESLNAWPGYVDALSTLLMVIIFVLLVFVLAQAFLSVALSGRDRALDRLNRQMAEMSDMLSLERGRASELRLSIAQLNRELQTATTARDTLSQQLAALRAEQTRLAADRDALKTDRDRLAARLADSDLQVQSAQSRAEQLQAQLADAAKRTDAVGQDAASTAAQLTDTRRQLTAAQSRLEEMQRQAAELDRTVQADRATIEARLSDLAKMAEQMRALTALRDELEQQVRDAAARAMTDEQKRAAVAAQLAEEQKLGESARAQIALLNRQVEEMRAQLASVAAALEASEKSGKDKDTQIANLGSRLNAALAQKVEELQRYRSDFFGKLRAVLANRPGIQVVGDRFVFQSEVLFPVGSADLTVAGWEQVKALAATLLDVSKEIPSDVNWILRVDGHADHQPVQSARFPSNWELSASRAITVVKLLIAEGVPASRLAATGFGDNQPLDNGDTPEAYAKNRRIEIRLTDR